MGGVALPGALGPDFVKKTQAKTSPTLPLESRVLVQRPHLWSGVVGQVVSHVNGMNRICIPGKNGGLFHTDADSQQLEVWPWLVVGEEI